MKIKENFLLRNVADAWVVMPIGQEMLDFNGVIKLNETGAFLWKKLEDGADLDDLARALAEEYGISFETAKADAEEYLSTLMKVGCLEK